MSLSGKEIDNILSVLKDFRDRLSNDAQKSRSGGDVSAAIVYGKGLSEITDGIITLSTLSSKLDKNYLSDSELVIVRHWYVFANQNYGFTPAKPAQNIRTGERTDFESKNNNAKKPTFSGLDVENANTAYSKDKEQISPKTIVDSKEPKIDAKKGETEHFQDIKKTEEDKTAEGIVRKSKETKKPIVNQPLPPSVEEKPLEKAATVPFQQNVILEPIENKQKPVLRYKFALYPDSPLGFLDSNLSETSDDIHVFELQFHSDNEASFVVVDKYLPQQKAMSNSSIILKNACQYLNAMDNGNRIVTKKKGLAERNGDTWKIIQKADIEFV